MKIECGVMVVELKNCCSPKEAGVGQIAVLREEPMALPNKTSSRRSCSLAVAARGLISPEVDRELSLGARAEEIAFGVLGLSFLALIILSAV